MEVALPKRVEKFLDKQERGDFNGIAKVRLFLDKLAEEPNPTLLSNCKKMPKKLKVWKTLGGGV